MGLKNYINHDNHNIAHTFIHKKKLLQKTIINEQEPCLNHCFKMFEKKHSLLKIASDYNLLVISSAISILTIKLEDIYNQLT